MKNLFIMLLIIVFAAACSKKEEQKTEASDQQTVTQQQETSAPVANHRYGVKSGYIEYSAPMDTRQELYFDDYGTKEVTITYVDMGVAKSKSFEINRDGYRYKFDEGKTEGTKSKWYTTDMDYSKADPETMERYKVKDLGTETIAGKVCKKWGAEFGGSPITTWVWNNILVKSITKIGNTDFIIEALKIQEVPVDPKLFELPAGVTFKEF